MRNRRLVFAAVLFVLTSPALAAGPLRVVQSLVDDPIGDASAVTVSGDGRHLYAVGHSALTAYERDPATGVARFLEAHYEGVAGVSALRQASSVALSGDGRFLYVAGPLTPHGDGRDRGGIAIFERDAGAGTVQLVDVHVNGFWARSHPLDVAHLALSPDGSQLYVATTADRCLFVFDRHPADGTLGSVQVLELPAPLRHVFVAASPDGAHLYVLADDRLQVYARRPNGTLAGIEQERNGRRGVRGMAAPRSVVLSPDGRHLYVLSPNDLDFDGHGTVVVFARDVASGRLDYLTTVHEPGRGVLDGATHGAVAAEGLFLYVALDADASVLGTSAVTVLARRRGSGALTFVELLGDDDLSRGRTLALSPEGDHLYLGSFRGRTLFPFRRSAADGLLTTADDPDDPSSGAGQLRGAWAVAASADGRHVYAASHFSHAVTAFERGDDGTLGFVQTLNATAHGLPRLRGVRAVTVSPDGRWVFVGGDGAHVAAFERDAASGELRFVRGRGPAGSEDLAVAPDSRHVYAAGEELGGVRAYEVAPSGELTEIPVDLKEAPGLGFLRRPRAVAASAGGRFVYVAGFYDCYSVDEVGDDIDALTVFARDADTGSLTPRGTFVLGGNRADRFPPGLTVGPEGGQLYLSRPLDNRLLVFTHDPGGRRLRRVQQLIHGRRGVAGLRQPRDVVLDPSGERLYVAGRSSDAVAVFTRNPRGRLSFVGATAENDDDVEGLRRPLGLAAAADGGHIYAVSLRLSGLTVLAADEESGP